MIQTPQGAYKNHFQKPLPSTFHDLLRLNKLFTLEIKLPPTNRMAKKNKRRHKFSGARIPNIDNLWTISLANNKTHRESLYLLFFFTSIGSCEGSHKVYICQLLVNTVKVEVEDIKSTHIKSLNFNPFWSIFLFMFVCRKCLYLLRYIYGPFFC